VHQVHTKHPQIPICGMGGIVSGEDALEFLMAGARCLQVGTANFSEPPAALRVRDELRILMAELGIPNLDEIVGCIERHDPEPPYASEPPS